MSRGEGRIERAILAAIERRKSGGRAAPMTARSVLNDCYPEREDYAIVTFNRKPTNAQYKAINRALHSIARRGLGFVLIGGHGRTPLILFEPDEAQRTALARLTYGQRGRATLKELAAARDAPENPSLWSS